MKNNYGKIGCIIGLLLTTFCGITLSGCGDENVSLTALVTDPEQYKEDRIEVYGQIVAIGSESTSFLVLLASDDNSVDDSSLICEFLKDELRSFPVEGQRVTISGKVDILAGITLLRECRFVE